MTGNFYEIHLGLFNIISSIEPAVDIRIDDAKYFEIVSNQARQRFPGHYRINWSKDKYDQTLHYIRFGWFSVYFDNANDRTEFILRYN